MTDENFSMGGATGLETGPSRATVLVRGAEREPGVPAVRADRGGTMADGGVSTR